MILVNERVSGQASWPQCLKHFRLRRLSITSKLSLAKPDVLSEMLLELDTSQLESLKLSIPDALDAIIPFNRSIPLSTQVSSSSSSHFYRDDIISRFSSLTSLRLINQNIGPKNRPNNHRYDLLFPLLPSSLTFLEIIDEIPSSVQSALQMLPPKLNTLLLPFHALTERCLTALPPQLINIGTRSFSDLVGPLSAPGLKVYPYSFALSPSQFRLLQDSAGLWPPNIETLKFHNITRFSQVKPLPQSLTSLFLDFAEDHDIDSTWITNGCLPLTLTEMDVHSCDWSVIEHQHWPPNLTSLTLHWDLKFAAHHFHRLPRALKVLRLSMNAHHSELDEPKFEANALLDLGHRMLEIESEEWIKNKARICKYRCSTSSEQVERYITAVENGFCYGLPLSLIEINFTTIHELGLSELILPPNLNIFSIAQTHTPVSSSRFWTHLPPSVNDIRVLCPSNKSKWPIMANPEPEASPIYNSLNITSMTLAMPTHPRILEYLPRSLRYLTMNSPHVQFQSNIIAHLPPNLESLHLEGCVFRDASKWLSALPRSITYLTIQPPLMLYGSDLHNLPPKLESLNACIHHASLDQILTMPRTLRYFTQLPNYWNPDEGPRTSLDLARLGQKYRPFFTLWQDPTILE